MLAFAIVIDETMPITKMDFFGYLVNDGASSSNRSRMLKVAVRKSKQRVFTRGYDPPPLSGVRRPRYVTVFAKREHSVLHNDAFVVLADSTILIEPFSYFS
jgi:hypothetical protein